MLKSYSVADKFAKEKVVITRSEVVYFPHSNL